MPNPEIVRLSDLQRRFQIEYSRPAMEKIRALAREGLMALPRVGMGVGGLLLGTRRDGVITLMDSVEIPCSHAGGPSFNLTGEEKEMVRELIAGAGQPGVIGWYCSKTRGAAVLGDPELAIYREFFAKGGQISLVLRPSAAELTRAAFFFRDAKGNVVKGVECELDEWRPAEAEMEAAAEEHTEEIAKVEPARTVEPVRKKEEEPAVASSVLSNLGLNSVSDSVLSDPVLAEPVLPDPVLPDPVLPDPVLPDPVLAKPVLAHLETAPAAAIRQPSPLTQSTRPVLPVRPITSPDMFAFTGAAPRRTKWLVWILGGTAILAAGAAAFFTQDSWLPRPPLTLSSIESNGNLVIRWNVDALRGIYHASMFVNDGGNLQSLPLDRFQLSQGVFIYSPKSQRVTAKLSAGETSAIAVWLAPVPAAPAVDSVAPTPDAPEPGSDPGKR